jgi:hypothetical protein
MLPNVSQLTAQLRRMGDPQLQQFAAMHKDNPYVLSLVVQEDTARKQVRLAKQAQTAGGEQPKVNDAAVAAIGQMPQMPMPPQGPGGPMPQGPRPPMPPQGAGTQGPAGLPGLNSGMQNMADGGIAGYPDEEEVVGMAEGGVARYNGQDGSRVRQDVQLARDQEAVSILLAELQKEQAKAAQGNPSAQSNVASIQNELRRHIKRNPSLAQMLTSALPIAAAQAAPAPAAAAPTPAGQIPGTPAQPVYKEPSLGQKVVGTGETALSLLTGIPAMVLGGAQTAQQAISQGRAPTEQEFASNVGRFTYSPRTEAGQDISEDVAKTLGRLPPYIPGAQLGRVGRAAAPAATAAEAEAAAAKVSAPRLAAPAVGATRAETEMAQVRGLAALKADQDAAATAADKAARAAVQAERRTPAAAYATQVPQRAGAVGAGATAMQAAAPSGTVPQETPTGRPISDMERARMMEAAPEPADVGKMSKEEKKAVIDAAKAATPKAERKGLTNDDYLVMGLTMMANPGRGRGLQGLLKAVGTGGMAAIQSRREREKSEREAAKEASEAQYREALGEQARRGPTEIALIERIAKENNVSFTKAMELIAGAKRDPQTEEALMKAWSSSAFLQMQYPNPQDYIKLMRTAAGGASQISAADQALVGKYLNPR